MESDIISPIISGVVISAILFLFGLILRWVGIKKGRVEIVLRKSDVTDELISREDELIDLLRGKKKV